MRLYDHCVLYDRACIECGECDKCDLDPEKTCDNCMKCVKDASDYRAIRIDGVLTEDQALDGEKGEDEDSAGGEDA